MMSADSFKLRRATGIPISRSLKGVGTSERPGAHSDCGYMVRPDPLIMD